MDLAALHLLSGLVSTVAEMAATVGVLFCVVSFFSYKPGGSTKFFYVGLIYFLLSYAGFFAGAIVLESITATMSLFGVATLFMAALMHLVYGILLVVFYIRMVVMD